MVPVGPARRGVVRELSLAPEVFHEKVLKANRILLHPAQLSC